MKPLDIEQLLHWAYQDELPKRDWMDLMRLSETESNWALVTGHGELLPEMVDDGRTLGNRYGVLAGEGPHPDALRINRAVRALDDPALGPSLEDPETLLSDMPAEVRAEAAAALDGYRVQVGALVTRCARLGTRPDWRVEVPQRKPVLAGGRGHAAWFVQREVEVASGGRMTVERNGIDPKTRRPYPDAYRKFYFDPPVRLALAQRADYLVWRAALEWLVERLAPGAEEGLANRLATGPAVAALPWEEGERPAPRVLAGRACDEEAA